MGDAAKQIAVPDAELMAKYGIKLVLTPRSHYRSFRYSSLEDAVRQAKRDEDISGSQ